MKLLGLLLLMTGFFPAAAVAEEALPSVQELVDRLVERGSQAQGRLDQHQFGYAKRSVLETLDQDGTVKERDEKLYNVYCRDGRMRMTLVEHNGEETKAGQKVSRGEKKFDPDDLKPAKGEERPLVLTKDMLSRFDFELIERTTVADRDSFLLTFKPKSGTKDDAMVDRFLNRLQGKIWIDRQDNEIVRAEIGLRSPVTIFGGIVGAVNRFNYTVERAPLGRGGIWLNRASQGDFEVRKVLVSRRFRTTSEWKVTE